VTKTTKIVLGSTLAVFLLTCAAAAVGIYFMIDLYQGSALLRDGYAAVGRRDYETAIAQFNAAMRKHLTTIDRAYAFQNRAYSENEKGKHDDAVRDYTEAIKLNPSLSFSYDARGALYQDKGETAKAFDDYSKAIGLDPNLYHAFHARGLIDITHKNWDKAVADFSEAVRTWPESASGYFNRGLAYTNKSDFDHALADFDAAIAIWPRYYRALVERGYVHQRRHELDRAAADFNEAMRIDSKDTAAFRARGYLFNEMKHWNDAVADFNKVLAINSKDVFALDGRGFAYSQLGDYEHALADLNDVIQIKETANAYRRRGAAYFRKGDHRLALADFREALKQWPNDPWALNSLAWFLVTCPDQSFRNGKEALIDATQACQILNWENAYMVDTLAAACAEAGDFNHATAIQQFALTFKDLGQDRATAMKKRLDLYLKHQPYREKNAPPRGRQ
jgi:tetratricopeptide (TPR) repeat protein